MNRLASVGMIMILLLWATTASAGTLGFHLGIGTSVASFGELNESIKPFNRILTDLNNDPLIDDTVPLLNNLSSGFAFQGGQQFWFNDRVAIGGKLEFFRASTATAGTFTLDGVDSEINIALDCFSVGIILGGRYMFLDAGIRLFADLGVGYYFSGFTRAITFQIPEGHLLAGAPPAEGKGRYTGSAFGFEGGLTISLPLTDWFAVGSSVFYRSLTFDELTNTEEGVALDLDGDGQDESVDLSGITVQFTFTIKIDLSL